MEPYTWLAKTSFTRDYVCAGWSKPLLVAHTTLLEISSRGSYGLGDYNCLKNFKFATIAAILDKEFNGTILANLNLNFALMPPTKFLFNQTYMPWRPSWLLEQNDFSNSKSTFRTDAPPPPPPPSIKFWFSTTKYFGRRCHLRNYQHEELTLCPLRNFSRFFAVCWFFHNQLFQKILSGIRSECITVWISRQH